MPKNYKEVNIGSRTVLLKSAYTYGGQILTVTASAPSDVYDLGTISENPTYVEVQASSSDGNGEGAVLTLDFKPANSYVVNDSVFYTDWRFISASPYLQLSNPAACKSILLYSKIYYLFYCLLCKTQQQ
jgi:hypothetical protein